MMEANQLSFEQLASVNVKCRVSISLVTLGDFARHRKKGEERVTNLENHLNVIIARGPYVYRDL